MAYPTITDYSAAMQNLRWNVSDEELQQGQVALLDALGLPAPCAGGYAAVYKVHCPATGNTWAVKCFTKDVKGQRERYGEIGACLKQAQLPFMVDFQYIEPGILVGGQRYPFLKMRWVEGLKLNQFVDHSLGERPAMLRQFLPLWVRLSVLLREKRIAHADLQHGNVLLVPHGDQGQLSLKLIDYDGMFVPSLAESNSGEAGHAAYQHPQRLKQGIYSAEVDRFPHLAIYSAIRCLTLEKGLWKRYDNGENLLFSRDDFEKPGSSKLFHELWRLGHPDIRGLAGRLILATQMPLDRVPLLHEVVREGKVLPLGGDDEHQVQLLLNGEDHARSTVPLPSRSKPPPGTLAGKPEAAPAESETTAATVACFSRALDHAKNGDYDQAITGYTEAIRLDRKYALAYWNRGVAYANKGENDKAIADYTVAIRIDPKYAKAYNNRGEAYARKGDYDQAVADHTEAILIDPKFAVAYRNRGMACKNNGDVDQAIADYTEAIRIDAQYTLAYRSRGLAHVAKGHYDKAIADYTKAIALNPKDGTAHNWAAWLLATCPEASVRDGIRAVQYARQACELTGWKEPDSLDTLAAAYAEKGDYASARKWQHEAIMQISAATESRREAWNGRLELYRRGKPYRIN